MPTEFSRAKNDHGDTDVRGPGIIDPSHTAVFTPYTFLTSSTPSPTGGVKISYTYPDRVYDILMQL